MDALADVLKTIRLHASTYFCSDFNTHWGMDISQGESGLFHVIVEGECWVKIEGRDEPIHMDAGDIVAFPTGGAHWISDQPDSDRLDGEVVVNQIVNGDNPFYNEDKTTVSSSKQTLLCGAFEYDSSISHPFLRDLPCFIHIQAGKSPELKWVKEIVSVLSKESKQPSSGSSVVIDRLTEVLFIQILRLYVHRNPARLGYLSALSDSKIGPTLNRIHAEGDVHWSVEALASNAALSRSAFTKRFVKLIGESPKTYLINWRMQKAKSKLENSDAGMYDIAQSAGYSSEAAFSKAFKQYFSRTPGSYRRRLVGELN